MDRGTLDFHRSMHDLVRADYLEEPASPALKAQGMYLIAVASASLDVTNF